MPAPDHTATPTSDPALFRIEGPIATITLNRPAAFNAIDVSIAKKLEQLGAEVEASDDIRVLVIEGQGRAFCAGGDLQTIGAAAASDTVAPVIGELLHHYHRSEEHTSELQSRRDLVCRLLLEKKKKNIRRMLMIHKNYKE